MTAPVVAIVGRPNVGKSTLFNALARRRISIVEPTSGVTRDRVSVLVTSAEGGRLELVDMGGMGIGRDDALADDVEEQIRYAVEQADALVLVVDADGGLTPADRSIAGRLRTLGKPLVLVANKAESARQAAGAAEFHALGLGEPMLVSALHRRGTGELRERLFALLEPEAGRGEEAPEIKVAVVGRRNVGKSTFINALAREKRVIVSEEPGTTRDAVDVRIERSDKVFVVIDTAGVRRKRQLGSAIEFFSQVRSEASIRRGDVAVLMLDARDEISRTDRKLADEVCRQVKPCVLTVNKWDLAAGVSRADFEAYVSEKLPNLSHAPVCFISALKGQRVARVLHVVTELWHQARTRVPTAKLNQVIEALKERPLKGRAGSKRPKIYYGTQVTVSPPTIVLFVNSPEYVPTNTRRFISSHLRSHLPFKQVPVLVKYRKAGAAAP